MPGHLHICHTQYKANLLAIWSAIAPLSNDRSLTAMESAYQSATESMRFCAPCIPHSVTVMVLDLAFYTKDPDGVGDTINVFLFSDPPLLRRL